MAAQILTQTALICSNCALNICVQRFSKNTFYRFDDFFMSFKNTFFLNNFFSMAALNLAQTALICSNCALNICVQGF